MVQALEIGLRLVGGFYVFAGLLGLHAMATDELMDKMLAALTLKPTESKESVRRWLLRGGSLAVGIAGAALMVLSLWAVPLLMVALALQIGWLVWARKGYPVTDELEAKGRRQSANAATIFAGVTVLVSWFAINGHLRPWLDPWALIIPVVAVALALFAARHSLWKPKSAPQWDATHDEPDEEIGPPLPPPERIRIQPSWTGGDIVDADTGQPVPYFDYLPHDLAMRIHYWAQSFHAGDDHEVRELWAEFETPADEAIHRQEGDEIAAELGATFGEVSGPIYPADIRYVGPADTRHAAPITDSPAEET